MKRLLIILFLFIGLKSFGQTTPTTPKPNHGIQMLTFQAWQDSITKNFYVYNGATYLWRQLTDSIQVARIIAHSTQPSLTGTGYVYSTAGTITYDTAKKVNIYGAQHVYGVKTLDVPIFNSPTFYGLNGYRSTGTSQYDFNNSAFNAGDTVNGMKLQDISSSHYLNFVQNNIYDENRAFMVKSTRTLTINGTTYDLSANRAWTVSAVTPNYLTNGYGINGLPFNGGTPYTWSVDSTKLVSLSRLATNLTGYVKTSTAASNYLTLASPNQSVTQVPTFVNGASFTGIGNFANGVQITGYAVTGTPILLDLSSMPGTTQIRLNTGVYIGSADATHVNIGSASTNQINLYGDIAHTSTGVAYALSTSISIKYKSVATYALMIADGTPTTATFYNVATDENKGITRTTYLWKPDGNREFFNTINDN